VKQNTLLAQGIESRLGRLALVIAISASGPVLPAVAQADANNPPPAASSPIPNAASEGDAAPSDSSLPDWLSIHGQTTFTGQYHPAYNSPFSGRNSLASDNGGDETYDATLFIGIRVWRGLEFYVDPEVDQGFGLSDTLGVAGFPSAEAYKIGAHAPYYETPRAFARYTLGLGGAEETVETGANQFAGARQADNVTITAGKFSVVDVFDTNSYAHDPRSDFLNWSIVDSGAFDYAANAWGFTYGGAVEWTQSWWTLRFGAFDLSNVPNQVNLDPRFSQFELVAEAEERHFLFGHPGKIKLLFFNNRGRMANYGDAVRLGQETGTTPDVSQVRRYSSRPGAALNLEQEVLPDMGAFARASLNDGHKETFDFTDINRSMAAGVSVTGNRWGRPNDNLGLAGVVNDVSRDARNYFAAGGLGVLVGDGQLPVAGLEQIMEIYYKASVTEGLNFTVDYQYIVNPAYDAARGPVNVIGVRVHAEF
jgi:high affinity Mn2+ porin